LHARLGTPVSARRVAGIAPGQTVAVIKVDPLGRDDIGYYAHESSGLVGRNGHVYLVTTPERQVEDANENGSGFSKKFAAANVSRGTCP
jgi:hypothetical protein